MTTVKTLVSLVLDESGSMGSVQAETIQAVNEYFSKLGGGGDFDVSILKFDTRGIRRLCDQVALALVPKLSTENYTPTGGTPLYDAVGKAITEIAANDARAKLIVIQTDGQENSSKEYNQASIEKLVSEKTAAGWQFVFLGADQSAWAAAQLMGIAPGNTVSYDSANIGDAMAATAGATRAYASAGSVASHSFTGNSAGIDIRTGKNPAAVTLGRLGGLKGGPARAAGMTAQERSDAARKAASARYSKPDEDSEPIL